MLEGSDAYHPHRYRVTKAKLVTLSRIPCAISLDLPSLQGDIYISSVAIVESVRNTLEACQPWGLGGWQVLEERHNSIVIVDGEADH